MINEKVIVLGPYRDCSKHRLAKHIPDFLAHTNDFEPIFYQPLEEVFSRVIVYDYPKRQTEIGVKAINEEIIGLVRKEHPKYVIWLSASYEFRESTFNIMRREGALVIGWFFDDETCFDSCSKWWIPYLDYCVTNDIEAVPKYRALNAWVTQAPGGTGIAIDRDWSNIEEKYDVSFVGIKKYDREQYINEIRKRNIPIHLFGRRWEGGYIPFEEMMDIFQTSKINLNFSKGMHNSMPLKGKIFEVCLAGGFLLTEYAPGIEKYFEIDKEIVCFKNAEEMIDKVIYYLSHDEERRAIAQAGWKRATQEYTSFHVLSRVFSEIEADVNAGRARSHPQELKMPRQIRKGFSAYYSSWVKAFSLENYKGLWQDAFVLSISYYPFNRRAWLYYILSLFPFRLRLGAYKLAHSIVTRLHSSAEKAFL